MGPADIMQAVDRKYDILQQNASSEAGLRNAQADALTQSTPFENALKAAQARNTDATTRTIGPLAQASIASTTAGIGETGARSRLYGSQAGLIGAQTQDIQSGQVPLGDVGADYYTKQTKANGRVFAPETHPLLNGTGLPATPSSGVTMTPVGAPASASGQIELQGGDTQQGHYDENGNWVMKFARGTSKVPGRGMPGGRRPMMQTQAAMPPGAAPTGPAPMQGALPGLAGVLQAAMGAAKVPGRGTGKVDTVDAKLAPGEAVVNKGAIKHIPGGRAAIAKANAKGVKDMGMGSPAKGKGKAVAPPPPRAKGQPMMPLQAKRGFATGTSNVPSTPTPPRPGDTTSSGSWGPPPTPPTTGGGLRDQLGMGVPRRISY